MPDKTTRGYLLKHPVLALALCMFSIAISFSPRSSIFASLACTLISAELFREWIVDVGQRRRWTRVKTHAFSLGVATLFVIAGLWLVGAFAKRNPDMAPTLPSLFANVCPTDLSMNDAIILNSNTDRTTLRVGVKACMDFEAKAQFVAFYIPFVLSNHPNISLDAAMFLIDHVQSVIDTADSHVTVGGDTGGIESANDLVFTHRVIFYYEQPLLDQQKDLIRETYRARGYDVNFRGFDYLSEQQAAWYGEHGYQKRKALLLQFLCRRFSLFCG